MDWIKRAIDWQVCGIAQVAGGSGAAGGWFLFCFYSADAGGSAYVVFSGVGVGIGGSLAGVVNPEDYGTVSSPWSSMSSMSYVCGVNPFSITDLNGSNGRLSTLGAGIGMIGYSATYISAGTGDQPDAYFFSQSCGGLSFGAGATIGTNGASLVGGWTFLKEAAFRP